MIHTKDIIEMWPHLEGNDFTNMTHALCRAESIREFPNGVIEFMVERHGSISCGQSKKYAEMYMVRLNPPKNEYDYFQAYWRNLDTGELCSLGDDEHIAPDFESEEL